MNTKTAPMAQSREYKGGNIRKAYEGIVLTLSSKIKKLEKLLNKAYYIR